MHKDLFMAFFRSGMLGYGGGLSAIPLMHKEVVERYEWMDDDEFSDVLALANTLPGPINTKMAGYIGWRLKGFWGLMNCVCATILPTGFLMILLLTTLSAFKNEPWVAGMSKGVLPVAGVMIGVLALDFIRKSNQLLGFLVTIVLALVSIGLIGFAKVHPALLIFVLIVAAFFTKEKQKEESTGRDK